MIDSRTFQTQGQILNTCKQLFYFRSPICTDNVFVNNKNILMNKIIYIIFIMYIHNNWFENIFNLSIFIIMFAIKLNVLIKK